MSPSATEAPATVEAFAAAIRAVPHAIAVGAGTKPRL